VEGLLPAAREARQALFLGRADRLAGLARFEGKKATVTVDNACSIQRRMVGWPGS
jgi:hypothetical protein